MDIVHESPTNGGRKPTETPVMLKRDIQKHIPIPRDGL